MTAPFLAPTLRHIGQDPPPRSHRSQSRLNRRYDFGRLAGTIAKIIVVTTSVVAQEIHHEHHPPTPPRRPIHLVRQHPAQPAQERRAGMDDRPVARLRGVTSNPSIFMNAVTKSSDYDASLAPLARAGLTPEQIFFSLAIEDIQAAADLFLPLYQQSNRGDGYVSLEVSPYLANDTATTLGTGGGAVAAVNRPT